MRHTQSPLREMATTTETDYWNDSCNTDELKYGIEHGAVGATSNPTIVHTVLQQQYQRWEPRVRELVAENPTADEVEVTWKLIEEITCEAASLLRPLHEESGGEKGKVAIQVSPSYYRDAERMIAQAGHFAGLAPNLAIKVPATAAGLVAAEELTYQGISTIITVSFSVSQVMAAAAAAERGFQRRLAEEKSLQGITANPVVMVGRVDDWLKVVVGRDGVIVDPAALEWAGVAVIKTAYQLLVEKGYRSRLMVAAYRNHFHWSEFIGGDLITTIPYKWAMRFNNSDVTVENRIDNPVPEPFLNELNRKLPEFRKAHEPEGLAPEEFEEYGATVRTLRGFIRSYTDLVAQVRDIMLPNPDL